MGREDCYGTRRSGAGRASDVAVGHFRGAAMVKTDSWESSVCIYVCSGEHDSAPLNCTSALPKRAL